MTARRAGLLLALLVACVPAALAQTPATNVTVQSDGTSNIIEFDADGQAVVVLRDTVPVTGTPDAPGTATIACDEPAGVSECVDTPVASGTTYYYQVFATADGSTYAAGAPVGSAMIVVPDPATLSWSIQVGASLLSSPEVIGDPNGGGATRFYVESGNDSVIRRLETNGEQADTWEADPPDILGVAQGQIVAGDITGSGGFFAYVSTQDGVDGYLYRQDMINPLGTQVAHVVGPSGADVTCDGWLQAGPRVILTRFGGPIDAVIVGTHCTSGENEILLYSLDLSTIIARYNPGNLGVMNGSGIIVYPNLYVQPMRREAGLAPSVVVLTLNGGGIASAVQGPDLGDIDADAKLLIRENSTDLVVVGNLAGVVYVLDPAATQTADLVVAETSGIAGSTDNGAVLGVGASRTNVAAGDGSFASWVAWTTDTAVHSVQFTQAGFDSSSYSEAAVNSPSSPLVLTGSDLGFPSNTGIFVGDGAGVLHAFDADTLADAPVTVEAGADLGDPVFEFNARVDQAFLVGSSTGLLHRVPVWVGGEEPPGAPVGSAAAPESSSGDALP